MVQVGVIVTRVLVVLRAAELLQELEEKDCKNLAIEMKYPYQEQDLNLFLNVPGKNLHDIREYTFVSDSCKLLVFTSRCKGFYLSNFMQFAFQLLV